MGWMICETFACGNSAPGALTCSKTKALGDASPGGAMTWRVDGWSVVTQGERPHSKPGLRTMLPSGLKVFAQLTGVVVAVEVVEVVLADEARVKEAHIPSRTANKDKRFFIIAQPRLRDGRLNWGSCGILFCSLLSPHQPQHTEARENALSYHPSHPCSPQARDCIC